MTRNTRYESVLSNRHKNVRIIASVAIALWMGSPVGLCGQTFKTLVALNGSNGSSPSSLVQGPDGNLWGTTNQGGKSNCGKIFKMTPSGAYRIVFSFNCHNGNEPNGLMLANDGNFYGTTFSGGSGNGGTFFRLTPAGKLTTLLNFASNGPNGSEPVWPLVQAADGNFYGATYGGGTSDSFGTIFKVTLSGALTTLYRFDFTHGALPYAGLVEAVNGDFYGTTYAGGSGASGTVFRITPRGVLTVLHNFYGTGVDGNSPITSLVQGRDGNFYGVTPYGGGTDNDGTIFKITPSGTLTTLHSFTGPDGRWPTTITQGPDGNFYGSTSYVGADNAYGLIFRMTSAGVVTTLHGFDSMDGANPAVLVQHTSGTIFGLTGGGGNLNCDPTYGCGTIYSLDLGFGSFVQAQPSFGPIGSVVTILGTNLAGATGVTFDGTSAAFTVLSSSEISAVVPTGAKSGKIRVATPSGVFSTNVNYRVTK